MYTLGGPCTAECRGLRSEHVDWHAECGEGMHMSVYIGVDCVSRSCKYSVLHVVQWCVQLSG